MGAMVWGFSVNVSGIEKAVIGRMLADPDLTPARRRVNFDAVSVKVREFVGRGFLTVFEPCEELKVFHAEVSIRWGRIGARLNASKVDTGYLIFVDDGYVSAVEGHTYREAWPTRVDTIELYELSEGMRLFAPRAW